MKPAVKSLPVLAVLAAGFALAAPDAGAVIVTATDDSFIAITDFAATSPPVRGAAGKLSVRNDNRAGSGANDSSPSSASTTSPPPGPAPARPSPSTSTARPAPSPAA